MTTPDGIDVGWFTPHADDETLTGLATIRGLVEAGYRVWTILMTTGVNSGARAATGLSPEEFGQARDDEYRRAVRALGVHPTRILYAPDRPADGYLTAAAAEEIMTWWLDTHTGDDAWVKTTTNLGGPAQHVDHRNAGQAGVNLLRRGTIRPNGLRLGVEQYQLDAFHTANPKIRLITDRAENQAALQDALGEYCVEDRPGWKFGIGGVHSVPSAFKLVKSNPVSYYHVPVL
jgi:LmbE family N-acetylglucosaminyl deacetylase